MNISTYLNDGLRKELVSDVVYPDLKTANTTIAVVCKKLNIDPNDSSKVYARATSDGKGFRVAFTASASQEVQQYKDKLQTLVNHAVSTVKLSNSRLTENEERLVPRLLDKLCEGGDYNVNRENIKSTLLSILGPKISPLIYTAAMFTLNYDERTGLYEIRSQHSYNPYDEGRGILLPRKTLTKMIDLLSPLANKEEKALLEVSPRTPYEKVRSAKGGVIDNIVMSNVDTYEAESILKSAGTGAFLIRLSSKQGCLAISMNCGNNTIKHWIIKKETQNEQITYHFEDSGKNLGSAQELVRYYEQGGNSGLDFGCFIQENK